MSHARHPAACRAHGHCHVERLCGARVQNTSGTAKSVSAGQLAGLTTTVSVSGFSHAIAVSRLEQPELLGELFSATSHEDIRLHPQGLPLQYRLDTPHDQLLVGAAAGGRESCPTADQCLRWHQQTATARTTMITVISTPYLSQPCSEPVSALRYTGHIRAGERQFHVKGLANYRVPRVQLLS
jgi:hypothetical protein